MHVATRRRRCGWTALAFAFSAHAAQIDIPGPAGSVAFGTAVEVLPNGNIVVTDPGAQAGRGAVYLYSPAGVQISVILGNIPGDEVGSGGVKELANGHFVICSPMWDNLNAPNAGAVTWGSGSVGVSGVVSTANSLVGTSAEDRVCSAVIPLANGNYIVCSGSWSNASALDVGAVTWVQGESASAGAVTTANSLFGAAANDMDGCAGVALANGNYVHRSENWDNAGAVNAGAVTWIDGDSGISGMISVANSLVGTRAGDRVGLNFVTELSNGNFVTGTQAWSTASTANVGAVTWGSGDAPLTGAVSASNSLVGSSPGDPVGAIAITPLANGNYVVASSDAVTWGNGSTGVTGTVSSLNSLVGTGGGVTALANGHYVIGDAFLDLDGKNFVGAVTWGDGTLGRKGVFNALNATIGSQEFDQVGSQILALSDGNYVILSPSWSNGAIMDAGAATWRDGSQESAGVVSSSNSLTSNVASATVGWGGGALNDGHYVVRSYGWHDGTGPTEVGAVTWRQGGAPEAALVSAANSLVGATAGDRVGSEIFVLANGNYVVGSFEWDLDASHTDVGASTLAPGDMPLVATVSPLNSLVGATSGDWISLIPPPLRFEPTIRRFLAFPDGNYAFLSDFWDASPQLPNSGAVTLGNGSTQTVGFVGPSNSVIGDATPSGRSLVFDYDPARAQLAVGRPGDNKLSLMSLPNPPLFVDGFEGTPANQNAVAP